MKSKIPIGHSKASPPNWVRWVKMAKTIPWKCIYWAPLQLVYCLFWKISSSRSKFIMQPLSTLSAKSKNRCRLRVYPTILSFMRHMSSALKTKLLKSLFKFSRQCIPTLVQIWFIFWPGLFKFLRPRQFIRSICYCYGIFWGGLHCLLSMNIILLSNGIYQLFSCFPLPFLSTVLRSAYFPTFFSGAFIALTDGGVYPGG
jgi:hypothetical protein